MTIVAECGQNHCGDMSLARELIAEAQYNGADLVKFQLYDSQKLYGEYQPSELTRDQAQELFEAGKEIGIEVFFSVFDVERIKWCEEIGVQRYKLACGFVNSKTKKNYDVGEAIVKTGKEVIISFSRFPDFPRYIYMPMRLLYCVPKYPANINDVDFDAVTSMDGFSDHTIGIDAAKIALARGAEIIEKHFSLSHTMGVDGAWSMTPSDLKELKRWENICKQVL